MRGLQDSYTDEEFPCENCGSFDLEEDENEELYCTTCGSYV